MSNAHLPPVPPANRAPQGGNNAGGSEVNPKDARANERNQNTNLAEQGQQGNIAQNTRNQGHQQDR